LSEKRLGVALKEVPRADYVLASKVGRLVAGETQLEVDYSRAGVVRSLEESLVRLDQDRIDIAHIHDPDQHFREALDIAFPALAALRAQGVIGAVGAGMNQWPMLLEFARSADFDCFMLAGRYTLLEQESLLLLDFCSQKGIAIFLGGVYNTGILATGAIAGARYSYRPAPPEILERVSRIEAVCSAFGVPLRAAALQFSAAHPAVKSLVIGAESRQEFDQAFDGLCFPIPPDFWQALRAARLIDEKAPVPQAS
jgi:D-threo-aldose 1-dehydrogenase